MIKIYSIQDSMKVVTIQTINLNANHYHLYLWCLFGQMRLFLISVSFSVWGDDLVMFFYRLSGIALRSVDFYLLSFKRLSGSPDSELLFFT